MLSSPRFLCAAALLACVGAAHAVSPSRGVWWNPAENGRGYELDRQGGTMTLTVYTYDATGRAIWYVGAGDFAYNQVTFDADAYGFAGGQCFGCAYSAPVGTEYGTISIQFTDAEHGVLSFPGGGSTPIEHFLYGYASKQDRLLGFWSFSATIDDGDSTGPQTLGEFLLFDSHYTAADGTVYVSGTSFVNSAVTALGTYSEGDDTFSVDVTLPDGTIHHYDLQGDDTLLLGRSSYGDSNPTNAVATRIEYYAPQLQGNTPASLPGLPVHAAQH